MLKTDFLYNAKNKVPCVIAHLKTLNHKQHMLSHLLLVEEVQDTLEGYIQGLHLEQ